MSLDVVIPAHNEQHRIHRTLNAYRAVLSDDDVRFVVALDDCTDSTADIVARHRARDPRVSAVEYPRLGKGGVLLETFRRCDADFVAFVDADGATPPAELLRLVSTAADTGADITMASRWHSTSVLPRRRSLGRRLASNGFASVVRRLFHMPYADTQCGAKVLRREVAHRVVPLISSRDFLFDVDLLLSARALGYDVLEVPTVWVDRDGSRLDATRDSSRMAASLLRLWLHHRVIPVRPPSRRSTLQPRGDSPALPWAPEPAGSHVGQMGSHADA